MKGKEATICLLAIGISNAWWAFATWPTLAESTRESGRIVSPLIVVPLLLSIILGIVIVVEIMENWD